MADDNILQIGTMVDVATIQSGMSAAAGAVESSTAAMSSSFEATAASTAESGSVINTTLGTISEMVNAVSSSFERMPAVTIPAIVETEGALTGLQEKLAAVAESGIAATGGLGAGFAGLAGILGAGALIGVIGHFADETNRSVLELGHLSEKSGVSIESLAGLQKASNEIGVSFDSVSMAMVRLGRAQALAVEGHKAQTEAFQRIGISVEELKGMTPEEVFSAVSGAMQSTASSGDRLASSIALLGRGGATLIPLFKEYGANLSEVMRQQGEATGINEAANQNALQFQKTSADLGVELKKLALDVMPGLTRGLKSLEEAFSGLSTGGSLAGVGVWAGKISAVFHELQGTANASAVMLRDVFTQLPGLPDDKAQAAHKANATELQRIWSDTAKNVREDLGVQSALSVEDSLASARKLAESTFPTRPNVPSEGGGEEKANEAKAKAEAILQAQLAGIDAWKAAQQVAYVEGKISAQDWFENQNEAVNMAYAAQTAYFNKLKAIYASDPAKESIVIQEQLKFEYKESAKTSDELAVAYTKLKTTLKEYGSEAIKSTELQKEQEADLKATSKSVQDYVASLRALGTTQDQVKGVDFASQEEAIRRSADIGVTTQRDASMQLIELYKLEESTRLADLQEQSTRQQAIVQSTQSAISAAEKSGEVTRLNEAKAAYNNALAAYLHLQVQMQQLSTQTSTRIDTENNKIQRSYQQLFTRITGPFNNFLSSMLTGQETMSQAWTHLAQTMAQNFINNLMLMVEQEAAAMIMHKAIAKDGVMMKAKEAAAWGFAEGMKLPFPADVVVAPLLAATAFTGVMAFGSFDKGGLVSGDMVGQLHAKEMVLPPALSTGVQNLINSGGTSNTSNTNTANVSNAYTGDRHTHVHIHQGDVQALDVAGVHDVLRRNQREIARTVQRSLATGHLDLMKGVY